MKTKITIILLVATLLLSFTSCVEEEIKVTRSDINSTGTTEAKLQD